MRHQVRSEGLVTVYLTAIIAAVAIAVTTPITTIPAVASEGNSLVDIDDRHSGLPGTILSTPVEADARYALSSHDHDAALEAIQIALMEVQDGASYVWRRQHGLLNGIVRPTKSFLDRRGRVCRHIVVLLNSGQFSRKTEGIACRQSDGIWSLEG